ncbi:MAG: N(2)-acetyl-L-2,4-diaminobutanoate deacetylase DoeB [Pseudomonadota bacterium]
MRPSPVSLTIDLEQDGVQHGFMKMPCSRDESAWGSLMTPITVVKSGEGPTAILTGANHGDEYEGPVALSKLANSLRPDHINGRVIIVPFFNFAAFRAGRRTSPIDGGNMNRVFPGSPDGTATEKMADYFQRHLLPISDYVLDIHAGGKTMDFVPFACAHLLPDKDHEARCVAAMKAFAAPYSMMLLEIDATGMYDTAAEDMGKVFVSTELGGGGSSSARSNEVAETGVHNFLVHAGIKHGELIARESVMLDMPDDRCFITSLHDGLLEMCVDLGERVEAGEVVACIYDASRTGAEPVEYRAEIDGMLAQRHFPGLIAAGDALAVIAMVV